MRDPRMRIAVVGGTGRVGTRLCARLREAGHDPVPASPSTGVDTVTGAGLDAAIRGARAVVDVSNPRVGDAAAALEFFRTSTGNLLSAEESAGIEHHVTLSVVGCDTAPAGYLRAKSAQERMVERGPIPHTILRATQFFAFLEQIFGAAGDGAEVRLPPVDIRPVALSDVATVLAELTVAAPRGGIVEVAGPEVFRMDELARRVLSARGDDRRVVADPRATYFGARLERHTLVPRGRARLGRRRLDDWLSSSRAARRRGIASRPDGPPSPRNVEDGR